MDFEVLFVSMDNDEESFREYYSSMPWLALPFTEEKRKGELQQYFEFEGIPTLIIVGPDLTLINAAGREAIVAVRRRNCMMHDLLSVIILKNTALKNGHLIFQGIRSLISYFPIFVG